MERFIPILGMLAILSVAALLSKNRKAIPWRTVGIGVGLQLLLALFVLRTGLGYRLMSVVSNVFVKILNCSFAGSEFVFGELGRNHGSFGFVFGFQALPMIIFVAALMSILYYLRVIPVLVTLTGRAMARLMGTSGAESLEGDSSLQRLLIVRMHRGWSQRLISEDIRLHTNHRHVAAVVARQPLWRVWLRARRRRRSKC